MKTKLFGVLLVSGALFLVGGCASKTTPPPSDANTTPSTTGDVSGTEQSTPAEDSDTGKVTDELWVELAAQDIYNSQKDPAGWGVGGGRERMFQANGVTEAQLEAFGTKLNSDPERAQKLIGKMAERVQQLQQE